MDGKTSPEKKNMHPKSHESFGSEEYNKSHSDLNFFNKMQPILP